MTEGQWSEPTVALGRQLMKLLPEDDFDHQPIVGGDGRYVLIADLRLDNREEITEALRIPHPQARSLCDAAVLLSAFEHWDEFVSNELSAIMLSPYGTVSVGD